MFAVKQECRGGALVINADAQFQNGQLVFFAFLLAGLSSFFGRILDLIPVECKLMPFAGILEPVVDDLIPDGSYLIRYGVNLISVRSHS